MKAIENLKRIQEIIKPFCKKKEITFISTAGKWKPGKFSRILK